MKLNELIVSEEVVSLDAKRKEKQAKELEKKQKTSSELAKAKERIKNLGYPVKD
jgi:hypothetical protein